MHKNSTCEMWHRACVCVLSVLVFVAMIARVLVAVGRVRFVAESPTGCARSVAASSRTSPIPDDLNRGEMNPCFLGYRSSRDDGRARAPQALLLLYFET